MNFKLLFAFFMGTVMSCFAQTGTVSGTVVDFSTLQPIPYATIIIKNNQETLTGGITDDEGNFQINNIPFQNFTLEVQFMGYQSFQKTLTLTPEDKILTVGVIKLEEEATQLDGVEVVAERSTIEQKIDRKVINVGRDLTTAGATASDILSNIPSVNVDQDGRLSLRGNENVRVLVDGRPTNLNVAQLLKQIPSTSIKKIELITNPSAKYNPEGMSGIINIILHKNANDGFNASFNTGLTIAERPKFNNSLNMNYRRGKVNMFLNYGNNFGEQLNWGNIERLDDASNQSFDIMNDNNSHLVKVGMDFYVNDKNTISVYTSQNFFSGYGLVNSDIIFPDPNSSVLTRDRYDNSNRNSVYNIAYKKLFEKEGHTLDVEVNHNDFENGQDARFNVLQFDGSPFYDYRDRIIDASTNTNINLDYVLPMGENSKLEAGAESRLIRTTNDYASNNPTVPVESLFSDYQYDVDIHSAYATFGQKIKKFSYQVGARFESYQVEAVLNNDTAFKDDFLTVYPSAFLSYSMNDKNQFQISYGRRVDRPSLEQTKPIREFSTPRIISIGNPTLDPQFTNSLEANYTRMFSKGSITTGVFYRHINDEINRVVFPNEEIPGNLILSYDNFDNNSSFGFEVSANYKITKWWDIQPSIDYSSINQQGLVSVINEEGAFDLQSKEVTVAAFNGRLNSNFIATKRLRFLLFGFYRGSVEGIQFTSREMYRIDSGARYSLWNDKATLSVRFNDMFNTMFAGFKSDDPYRQRGEFRWESQSLFIGFNYSFGAGKNRAMQRRQRDTNTKQGGGGII